MIYAIAWAAISKLRSFHYRDLKITPTLSEVTMHVLQLKLSVTSRFMNVSELSAFQLDFSVLKPH